MRIRRRTQRLEDGNLRRRQASCAGDPHVLVGSANA